MQRMTKREREGKRRQTDMRNKRASKNLAKIFNHLSGMQANHAEGLKR